MSDGPALPDVDALAEALCENRRPGRGPCAAHRVTAEAVLATGVFEAWREQIAQDTLRAAAGAWDSAEPSMLKALAEKHYRPGGPSMPAIFLRLRADALGRNARAAAADTPDAIKARIAALTPKGPADEWIH